MYTHTFENYQKWLHTIYIIERKGAMAEYKKRDCYVNRELSWLKFNERVLEEAEDTTVPILERLGFVSIFQSNLDEFFMVRVGSLYDQMLLPDEVRDNKTNMTSKEQLRVIMKETTEMISRKDLAYQNIMKELEGYGVHIKKYKELTEREQSDIYMKFKKDIKPLLFPTILGKKQPIPFLRNKEIYGVAVLETKGGKRKIGIVPCSTPQCERLLAVNAEKGKFILLEEVILHFLEKIFSEYKVVEKSLIRIIRNADIDESSVYDEDLDYREHMAEVVKMRRKLSPVRMDISRNLSEGIIKELCDYLKLEKKSVFRSLSPLDYSFTDCIRDYLRDRKEAFYEKRRGKYPIMLEKGLVLPQIEKKDVLLSYPYESMEPFLRMLLEAADDEEVVAIQMTLYRLAKNSQVVEALIRAAENGKEVDVLVELKARFDEENNINWSRKLEDAGCNVTYGLEGLKVHSKLCLITKKTENGISYITHIGTGNYNETTARLYTDLSILTSKQEIGKQVAEVFWYIFLGETIKETGDLLVAPNCLQNRILTLIDEEIKKAERGEKAYIGIKVNSLTDKAIIDKLIAASKAGVNIQMIIRGICCLKPGIPGYTHNIQIKSIVGRLLEHSRIYIFGASGENRKVYISSADFMTRNTLRRVEVAVPILDETLQRRVEEIFSTMWKDNVKAREMLPNGTYQKSQKKEIKLCAQELFCNE